MKIKFNITWFDSNGNVKRGQVLVIIVEYWCDFLGMLILIRLYSQTSISYVQVKNS